MYLTQILQSIKLGRRHQWFNIPDHLRVLVDAPVTREEAHTSNTGDALRDPFLLVLVSLINQILGLAVAVEVVGDEIVVAVLDNTIHQGREGSGITKGAFLDFVKDRVKALIELITAVDVPVTKVFDILGQVTEKEDVVLANFAGNFDLTNSLVDLP
jgi:hypothetical protein